MAALQRETVPAVALGRIAAGDGVDTPHFLTGIHVVPGKKATAGLGVAARGHALDDDAVCH